MENLFKNKTEDELKMLYEQYIESKEAGSIGNNELGKIRDAYFEFYGATSLVMLQVDLLSTIAQKWYDQKEQSSVTASSAVSRLEINDEKLYKLASEVWEDDDDSGAYGGRHDDIDWTIYNGPEDINAECILYVFYGLEDGEDYQLINGINILITDTANEIWRKVKKDLC